MAEDALEQFARSIEDAFYREGVAGFREALAAEEAAAAGALARATGIDDVPLLRRLSALGVRPETLAALTLIPLIEAAWADGVMDDEERDAVLRGAETTGIAPQSASHRLLALWTRERPAPELVRAWRELVAALAKSLGESERAHLRTRVIGRAWAVARAAGTLLDARPHVSPVERTVLDDLDAAFGAVER